MQPILKRKRGIDNPLNNPAFKSPADFWALHYYPFYCFVYNVTFKPPFLKETRRNIMWAVDALSGFVYSIGWIPEKTEDCQSHETAVILPPILSFSKASDIAVDKIKSYGRFKNKRNIILSVSEKKFALLESRLIYKPFWINVEGLKRTKSAMAVIDATNGEIGGSQNLRIAVGMFEHYMADGIPIPPGRKITANE